ncbi:MAG: alpha/beta fold hydrolase, partial [Oscillospiraceae bacterium]|nr:alpha/beta fold hydrolase [Oscillospiraceae bacterium]
MFISDGNVKIKVKRYLANNSKETGTIIISHEFGLNMLSTARYARGLRRAGYNVFIFDFAGSGSGLSKGRRSTDMSVLTEKDDLKLVFEHVKKLDYVDPDKLILGGASQGGFVTALFSAERKDEVQKMFLYYPAFNIPDDSKRGNIIGT